MVKSTSTENLWHLESCNIKSPAYQTIVGNWVRGEGKNNTDLQANLQINKLENALHSWKISPAVEARKELFNLRVGGPEPLVILVFQKQAAKYL